MLAQSVNHVTLDKAPRPTKSEWDSAVLEGVVRCEGIGIDRSTTIKTTKALTIPTIVGSA